MEYWTCSADPQRDQPIRQLALTEANSDPWDALRLLVDPAWHQQRAEALTAAPDPDPDPDPGPDADGRDADDRAGVG